MKNLTLLTLLISTLMTNACKAQSIADNVKFASVEKANELLLQEDNFTMSWSKFDIDSRMHKPNSTKEELLQYITTQTREWTSEEKERMTSIFKSIEKLIAEQGFVVDFPKEIYFVKTTTQEEGGAGGYTRGSYVVLNEEMPAGSEEDLKSIIVHELFHVLTRHSPEFREQMYGIIGFHIMNDVPYPKELKPYRITNPDAPQVDSYIKLDVDGSSKDCMMILYSKSDYVDGSFFKYLNIGFLSLTGDDIKIPEYGDQGPVIYSMQEVSGFFEQVGKNTQYIIHPEEILADNFTYTILNKEGLPNAEIVDKIREKLKK